MIGKYFFQNQRRMQCCCSQPKGIVFFMHMLIFLGIWPFLELYCTVLLDSNKLPALVIHGWAENWNCLWGCNKLECSVCQYYCQLDNDPEILREKIFVALSCLQSVQPHSRVVLIPTNVGNGNNWRMSQRQIWEDKKKINYCP